MSKLKPLPAQALYTRCDPAAFGFTDTSELPDIRAAIGQSRASDAIHFGVNIRREGYNLYVMGPPGSGKQTLTRQYLQEKAVTLPTPDDWCYVNNFSQGHKPSALRLPPGQGNQFRQEMEKLVEALGIVLPATFEGEEYRNRLQVLEEELNGRQESTIEQLVREANDQQIQLLRTTSGFTFAPMKGGEVLEAEKFARLPVAEQEQIKNTIAILQEKLQILVRQFPLWHRDTSEKVGLLNCETTQQVVQHLITPIKERYSELPELIEYLNTVEQDVIDNVDIFLPAEGDEEGPPDQDEKIQRYQVTVLVDNRHTQGAPIIYQDNPSYLNLVGRAEQIAQLGTLIKAGALHQANGGYLLIDAGRLLSHPFAWDGLKRALRAAEIRIESPERMLALVSSISLEPQAIPLDVKIVLMGDRQTYYLLHAHDQDFAELFKVAVDLDEQIPRNADNQQAYAQLVASLARKEKLRPFDRYAVARVIEHGSRLVEDARQLSAHMRSIADVLREADYWAEENGQKTVGVKEIQQAIDKQIHRSSRVRERLLEEVESGILILETDGSRIGQVNGLSVLSMGDFSFGQVSRITATAYIGEDSVVDIEREVELGGAIHAKGVLILSSFLGQRYASNHPLALSASLVFEQNYGLVDGDSASLAELCALLSVLADLPILQSLAVTGAVSQYGEVQPVSGVNEKIEGFFDVCSSRGLTGKQGVLIPARNVRHLMLREDLLQAASEGNFHIYAVASVDEALSLLLHAEAGVKDADGNWPEASINGRIQARLVEMACIRASFADQAKEHDEATRPADRVDGLHE